MCINFCVKKKKILYKFIKKELGDIQCKETYLNRGDGGQTFLFL